VILYIIVGVVSDLIPNSRCNQQSYTTSLRAWGIGVRSLSLLRNRCKNPPHPTPCDLFIMSRVTFSTCLPMDDHHFGYTQKKSSSKKHYSWGHYKYDLESPNAQYYLLFGWWWQVIMLIKFSSINQSLLRRWLGVKISFLLENHKPCQLRQIINGIRIHRLFRLFIHLNCRAVTSLFLFTLIAKLATAKSFLLALPTKARILLCLDSL
jgi:hypothetical protein